MTNQTFRIAGVMVLLIALLTGFGCGSGPQNTNNATNQGQNQNNTAVSNVAVANTENIQACKGQDMLIKQRNVTKFVGDAFDLNDTIKPHIKDGSLKFVITRGKTSPYEAPVRFFFTGDVNDAVRMEMLTILKPLRGPNCIASLLHPKSGKSPSIPDQALAYGGEDPSFWVECQDPYFPCPEACMLLPCSKPLDPTPVPTP